MSRVLLLTPSCGLGGGIERYAETLQWTFSAKGIPCDRIDLQGSGVWAHRRMLTEANEHLRQGTESTRLIVVHRALLPVAFLLRGSPSISGMTLICHGSDVWGSGLGGRRAAERQIMRSPSVRVVAVSSFTAGALSGVRSASVLSPGLAREWFTTLAETRVMASQARAGIELVTVFRLGSWRDKGLPEILSAVASLDRLDVRCVICGTGDISDELLRLVRSYPWCTLRPRLNERELACQLAEADLFVLATRTKSGRRASGEGFGMVLMEAQLAGTPVIAPAYGGSQDAYLDGITGIAPTDESAEALSAVLDDLLQDRQLLAQMGRHAGAWARESFDPDRYASRAVRMLL